MKNLLWSSIVLVGLMVFFHVSSESAMNKLTPEQLIDNLHWFGQAAFKINVGNKVIYIDPYRLKAKDRADIILITHSHGDHLSKEDITRISHDSTVIIAPRDCVAPLEKISKLKVIPTSPGKQHNLGGIKIEVVPAYNMIKTNFHPKEKGWVGYIVSIDGVRIYHAGDTERIPEMQTFACDIALLPLGQTYTMSSVKEAAEAAIDVRAKIAIPMHYGLYEGTQKDADTFQKMLEGKIKVILLKEE